VVHIHLISEEYQSIISSNFEVVSSYQKLAVAYVTPEELYNLANFDFIEKITIPYLSETHSIPKSSKPQTQTSEKNPEDTLNDYLVWIILGGIVIGLVLVVKYQKSTKKLDSN
jgi:hypothetical protein